MPDAQPIAATLPAATHERNRRIICALYLVAAVIVAYQRTVLSRENNFVIFRAAFDHLMAGQDLYAAWPALHTDFFKYSPTFAFLFGPFALVPVTAGYALWAATCATAVFAGVSRLVPPRLAVITLALALLAVVGDLQRAQSNALCAGLMILAWAAMEREEQWGAAVPVALGAFVKLFPVAALAGAIFHPRKIRFGAVVAVTLVVGVALPLVAVSWDSLAAQYASWRAIEARDAVPLGRYGSSGSDLYAGIMGQFRVWFDVEWPHWPIQLAGLAVLLLPLATRRRPWDRVFRTLFLASILVFCVLFNHQAESPSYSIAIIGACLWFAVSEQATWRTVLLVLCIAIVNLGSTDLMPRAWYKAYYVPYMLKTLPLIPLWIAMQLELHGVVRNAGASELREGAQGHATRREAVA